MRIMHPKLLLCAQLLLLPLSSAQEEVEDQWQIFKTQPDFLVPQLNISQRTKDSSKLSPGFHFLSPYGGTPSRARGPQIYDQEGELVWMGSHIVRTKFNIKRRTQNFRVCDRQGTPNHLCWTEGAREGPEGVGGRQRIFNMGYQQNGEDYIIASSWTNPSPVEFNMMPGGEAFLQVSPKALQTDLRPYKGLPRGWVLDACFQDVSVRNGNEYFRWCYLDHFKLGDTQLFLNTPANTENTTSELAGKGTKESPWNFADLNSVDKDAETNYLLSFKHLNQIVKISGLHSAEPGKPVYRIGGTGADYTLDDDALFTRQHHARFVSTSEDEDLITVFDNHWSEDQQNSTRPSSCLLISVNKATSRASLKRSYSHPEGKVSQSDGSCQVMANGNVLVGWGSVPEYTEFDNSGNVLYHASYSNTPLSSWRIQKYEFDAKPANSPKLLAYCWACVYKETSGKNPLMAYVSWNGATRIHSYRFSLSHRGLDGPWFDAGTYCRTGFETAVELSTRKIAWVSSFAPYVMVEALSASGKRLVNGVAKGAVFVPGWEERKNCNREGCFNPPRYAYRKELSRGTECPVRLQHSSPLVFTYMLFFAVISTAGVGWCCLILLKLVFGRCIPTRRVWSGKRRVVL